MPVAKAKPDCIIANRFNAANQDILFSRWRGFLTSAMTLHLGRWRFNAQ